ncbi:hypothetical protein [Spirosoma endbachense]|uniref:Uncharacterized protein n=1 Tax=Spirosoma endbachense TaxID=2666025 RepID=A0A6P1VYP1_9BACT|nr:hypothetical protein [Spirosoma endbachense]QHV97895.1 hypothetical protein GJR95_24085 [Spirosoma endbachense]
MELTHDLLLNLGFVKSPGENNRYRYKSVVGHLMEESGLFYFRGFDPKRGSLAELSYLLRMVDYRQQFYLAPLSVVSQN